MEIIGIETATYEKTLKEIENFLDTIDKFRRNLLQSRIFTWQRCRKKRKKIAAHPDTIAAIFLS